MKKARNTVLLVIAAGLIAAGAWWAWHKDSLAYGRYGVLVVTDTDSARAYPHVLAAYRSVLEEEGVPFIIADTFRALALKPADAVRVFPVIILPDAAAQSLPSDFGWWLERYLAEGGGLAVIYDAGVREQKGCYRSESVTARLTGVNHMVYERLREKAYTKGNIEFRDEEAARRFQIPGGKTVRGKLLAGYEYGTLQYPVARVELKSWLNERDVYAYAVTGDNERLPALVMRRVKKGTVLYVNLPLGSLKAYSDDLPLRAFLRTFLFNVCRMPRLANTPGGRGGIVVNWHIDASNEFQSIPLMLRRGYLRKSLQFSLHVTAGDFRDRPGDGLGFDAAGGGREYLKELMPYGEIGSHGGWGHNWFAENIVRERFGEKEIDENILKNNEALRTATGRSIIEYSAPNGVHPQPVMTKVLERRGFTSYYYTGDSGSAPNRTFIYGRMVSGKVIAFPIMPFGQAASFYEMKNLGRREGEVAAWLRSAVDYAADNHAVRLVYSHPYDIAHYPLAIREFLDYLEKRQKEGAVDVRPMSHFASFMLRFLKTETVFRPYGGGLAVECDNPEGLRDMTVVLPSERYRRPSDPGLDVREQDGYYYCTFTGDDRRRRLLVPALEKGES